jgi:fructose-1-phosphate kinase PfkB-like protein
LETNWNEDGVDISSDDIKKFKDRISEASKKDEAVYRTGTTDKDGLIER